MVLLWAYLIASIRIYLPEDRKQLKKEQGAIQPED